MEDITLYLFDISGIINSLYPESWKLVLKVRRSLNPG